MTKLLPCHTNSLEVVQKFLGFQKTIAFVTQRCTKTDQNKAQHEATTKWFNFLISSSTPTYFEKASWFSKLQPTFVDFKRKPYKVIFELCW